MLYSATQHTWLHDLTPYALGPLTQLLNQLQPQLFIHQAQSKL
jgi:hypothetical protein